MCNTTKSTPFTSGLCILLSPPVQGQQSTSVKGSEHILPLQLPKDPCPLNKVLIDDTFLNGQMLYPDFYNLTETHSYDSDLKCTME